MTDLPSPIWRPDDETESDAGGPADDQNTSGGSASGVPDQNLTPGSATGEDFAYPEGTATTSGGTISGYTEDGRNWATGNAGPGYRDQPRAPAEPIYEYPRDQGEEEEEEEEAAPGEFPWLRELLATYGIPGAFDDIVPLIASDASSAEIEWAMKKSDAFKERFPQIHMREEENERRRANGESLLTPISAADVINYESNIGEMFSLYGVPDRMGTSIQQIVVELMSDDVSIKETEQRLLAQRVFADEVLNDPALDAQVMEEFFGKGVTPYDIAEYALNPDATLNEIEQRLEAANVSNEAAQAGYRIEVEEAMALQQAGLTADQAQAGFGSLVQGSQVVDGIGNEEDPVSRAQELAALAGDVAAQAAIERAAQTRTAAFEVGGGFARDDDGFGGLR